MAKPRDLVVRWVSDVKDFVRGTDQVERALTDVQDELRDTTRKGEQEAADLARAYDRAGEKIRRDAKTTGKAATESLPRAGHLGGAGKEIGGEFVQNIGEGISNAQGNVTDAVLGTLGGVLPALGAVGAFVGVGVFAVQSIISGLSSQSEELRRAGAELFTALRDGALSQSESEDFLTRALGVDSLSDAIDKVSQVAGDLNVDKVALLHAYMYPDDPANASIVAQLEAATRVTGGLENATSAQVALQMEHRDLAVDMLDILKQQNTDLGTGASKVAILNSAMKQGVDDVTSANGDRLASTEKVLTKEQEIRQTLRDQIGTITEYSVKQQAAINTEDAKHSALMTKINERIAKAATTRTKKDDEVAENARRKEETRHALFMANVALEKAAQLSAVDVVTAHAIARVNAVNKIRVGGTGDEPGTGAGKPYSSGKRA